MDTINPSSDLANNLLEELIANDNTDPNTIQELVEQIIEKNASDAVDPNESIHKEESAKISNANHLNENDNGIQVDIADPIMNKDLVNVDFEKAYEETPEFFVPIKMIYISCIINDQYITAFVDTGAQISVMNLETAIKCGLYERIDTTRKGVVVGVGSQESLGYAYHVEMILGQYIVPCNFMILRKGPNIIIGLNFMKTHKVLLDMGANLLKIGTQEISFLGSKDVVDGFDSKIHE